jgi:hypothetical protein
MLAVLPAVMLALQGCGGDDASATNRTCAAKDDLSASIRTVVDDVRAGNLGDARDHLDEVRSRASDLGSAVSDLGSQERDRLQPQVDKVRDELKDLTSATSLSELSSGVTTVTSSASALFSDLGDDLSCD